MLPLGVLVAVLVAEAAVETVVVAAEVARFLRKVMYVMIRDCYALRLLYTFSALSAEEPIRGFQCLGRHKMQTFIMRICDEPFGVRCQPLNVESKHLSFTCESEHGQSITCVSTHRPSSHR